MAHSSQPGNPVVGVLALQGDYASHAGALEEAGAQPRMVRTCEDLAAVDALIVPGGESTTFLNLLKREGLFAPLSEFARSRPTFGTCAGCILLAKHVRNPDQLSLGILDATVERNAYGRQIDSEILVEQTSLPGGPLEMVFIRAPRISQTGESVEILGTRDGAPVLVRQRNILASTFHPELSQDGRVHGYFLQMIDESRSPSQARSGRPAATGGSPPAKIS